MINNLKLFPKKCGTTFKALDMGKFAQRCEFEQAPMRAKMKYGMEKANDGN
jgi:hypothetical protein